MCNRKKYFNGRFMASAIAFALIINSAMYAAAEGEAQISDTQMVDVSTEDDEAQVIDEAAQISDTQMVDVSTEVDDADTTVQQSVIFEYDDEGQAYDVYHYTYIEGDAEITIDEDDEIMPRYDNGADSEEPSEKEAAEALIKSLAVASNFDIYAEKFNENCHIDGNIAVKELTTDTYLETLRKGGYTAGGTGVPGLDTYSIVYNGNHLKYQTIESGAYVFSGGNLSVDNLNGGSKLIDITDNLDAADTDADKIQVIADAVVENYGANMSEEEKAALEKRVKREADIDGSLEDIAKKAEALRSKYVKQDGVTASNVVDDARAMIQSGVITSDDTIIIYATIDDLNDSSASALSAKLDKLLKDNKDVGATIIMNVLSNADDAELVITTPLNGNGAYEPATSYMIWNFGNYGGKVTYQSGTEGRIVAPKATVTNNGPVDGTVIAKTAIQNAGQEIHQPNVPHDEIPEKETEETDTEETDPKETDTKETEETDTKETEETDTKETEETDTEETDPKETDTKETEETDTKETEETDTKETEETDTEETDPKETDTKETEETDTKETEETDTKETEETDTKETEETDTEETDPKETDTKETEETDTKETEETDTKETEETDTKETEETDTKETEETDTKETEETDTKETEETDTKETEETDTKETEETDTKETEETDTKKTESKKETESKPDTTNVNTGDSSNLPFAAGLAVVSGFGLMVVSLRRKKEE